MTANPPSAQFANKTQYVFRFKPPTTGGKFVASDPGLSSPAFLLLTPALRQDAAASATTSDTATPSPTNSRAIPSLGAATSVAGSEQTTPEMSQAAAAGLTIGLILVVALLVAMEVAYVRWRRKKRREAEADDGMPTLGRRRLKRVGTGDRGLFVMVDKAELVLDDWMSPELPGDSTWGQRLVHELQGTRLGRGYGTGRTMTINSSVVELEAATS
jgi:hypothetical protein